MENETLLQLNNSVANGIRDMIFDFSQAHPHATKIIVWTGITVMGVIGICVESATLKSEK